MNDLDRALDAYDSGALGRRELLTRLAGLLFASVAGATPPTTTDTALFHGTSINHVTMFVSDVRRSKAFYTRLLGLPVRDEGPDFCEFRCGNSFLGLYEESGDPRPRPGIDHVCVGVEGLDIGIAFKTLQVRFPSAGATLEEKGTQVYVRDPDGIRVQLSNANYKR